MNILRRCRTAILLALSLVCPSLSAAQTTATGAEREVLAVVDSLFAAMKRRDGEALRRVMVPGAVFYATSNDGVPAAARSQADTSFMRSISTGTSALLERYWSPTVMVTGNVAQVWTPYDFHIDGKFSHCGIDSFSLLRTAEGWRLAAITYTVQRKDCAPSPLGSPR